MGPIPDQNESKLNVLSIDSDDEDENEAFDIGQIDIHEKELIEKRRMDKKSAKEERKEKLRKRRASSKRKSFKTDKPMKKKEHHQRVRVRRNPDILGLYQWLVLRKKKMDR